MTRFRNPEGNGLADDDNRQAEQEQLERRRLARLVDALPIFSGFISPDGHLIQSRPQTSESFLWALPQFAYAHDSISQIVDLCEKAAGGRRVQIERSYIKEHRDDMDIFGRGLLTLSPMFDDKGHIDEIAVTLLDCEENGLTPPDQFARSRLANANTRVEAMLSLAQTVIEVTRSEESDGTFTQKAHQTSLRDRLSHRLDALASIIDIISHPDRAEIPIGTLLEASLAQFPDGLRHSRLRTIMLQGSVPIAFTPLFALLLSELLANARDYGAWHKQEGRPLGHVSVESQIVDSVFGRSLRFHWIEDGGPPVPATLGSGFGFTLAERLFPQITGGTSHLMNSEDGISWTFELPIGSEPDRTHFHAEGSDYD